VCNKTTNDFLIMLKCLATCMKVSLYSGFRQTDMQTGMICLQNEQNAWNKRPLQAGLEVITSGLQVMQVCWQYKITGILKLNGCCCGRVAIHVFYTADLVNLLELRSIIMDGSTTCSFLSRKPGFSSALKSSAAAAWPISYAG